jgi:hypothetical protein
MRFWILDFGFWIAGREMRQKELGRVPRTSRECSQTTAHGAFQSKIQNPKSKIGLHPFLRSLQVAGARPQ